MLFEHFIYSTAIAIIAGMIHFKKTGRDYSLIIIASALAPDLDIFAGYILKQFGIGVLINGTPFKHGDLHNIAVLLIFAGFAGLLLRTIEMKFKDSFIFAGIGFGAHIFEDMLVYDPGYTYLWPFSGHVFSIGIVEYEPGWYGVANTEVLIAGIIAMILCGTVRMLYEGNDGIKKVGKAFATTFAFSVLIIPAILLYDGNLREEISAGNIVENWQFTRNTLWDNTIFYNDSHSARIDIPGNESIISGVWKSNIIPVKPDTGYTFSSWGKVKVSGGGNSPAVRVVELDVNGKLIEQTNLVFSRGTNNWTQKKIVFKTSSNTGWVYIYGNIWKGYGTFWFDDVELSEEGTDKNIVPNGGFESGVRHILNFGTGATDFLNGY